MSLEKKRLIEVLFALVFSVVVLAVFYSLTSMNGLVLGNDPAVHLEKAQSFLQTGQISLANVGWTPPLFQILLATFISFTGASSLGQMILLEKMVAVVGDWLLFFSVYLIGSKFFGRKVGATSAVLLLMCFPIFELNEWGGYTSVMGLAFMFLVFLYLPLAARGFGHVLVTFLAAFSLVLSHQLAAFLAVLILPPVIIVMLVKSRGTNLKALIALVLGGGIAFFLYYFQAMIGNVDVLIEHVFFSQKAYVYQIPATTLSAFMVNFGFVFVAALGGIFVAFFSLRAKKKLIPFLILFLSFIVPFVLAESYLFGLYLPFQWFIYYLMPAMAVFAAVLSVFLMDRVSLFYLKYRTRWRRGLLGAVMVAVIALAFFMVVFRFGVVYGKVMEASVYYSTSDPKAYDAGLWLKNNFPGDATVVVTDIPGFWFRLFSGKTVIAQTNPTIERNLISESVLDLAYELEQPVTLVRTYEAKGGISDEYYVSINGVWNRVTYSSGDGDFVSYRDNGVDKKINLSSLSRSIIFEPQGSLKRFEVCYANDAVAINKTIIVPSDSYSISVSWTLLPLRNGISNASLYVSTFFDLHFSLEKAYVPGVLDWENPWSRPTYSQGSDWAVVNFTGSTLTNGYLGFYAEADEVAFALKLQELPEWGNVGALASRQIDAVRFQYDFSDSGVNQPESVTYQIVTFSKSSLPEVQPMGDLKGLFEFKPSESFEVKSRDYHDFIRDNDIGFLVYDRNQLDTKIIRAKILELVYSNDRYVIFRIKSNS